MPGRKSWDMVSGAGGQLRLLTMLVVTVLAATQTVRTPSDTGVIDRNCGEQSPSSVPRAFVSAASTSGTTSFVIGAGEPLPFDVQGGVDFDRCSISTGDETREGGRPQGLWDFVVEARVPKTPQSVFNILQEPEHLLAYAFGNLAFKVRPLDEDNHLFSVELNSGESIEFTMDETDKGNKHHVLVLTGHSSGVFDAFTVTGSRLYFWVAPGDHRDAAVLEFGFEGVVSPESLAPEAKIAVESLLQQWLSNLAARFGESCELIQFSRTIEGDCNNLANPRAGAANHLLKRLPSHDPSFGDGISSPGGAKHISPRKISNVVFAESLGPVFLKEQATTLYNQCFSTAAIGATRWDICITGPATISRGNHVTATLDWLEVFETDSGAVQFRWTLGDDCQLVVAFRCGGEEKFVISDHSEGFEFVGERCGRRIGWLYSPRACSHTAGEDGVAGNSVGLTDMFWTLGQFLDHDLDLTPENKFADARQPGFLNSRVRIESEEFPIEVPDSEYYFTNNETLEFKRSEIILKAEHNFGPADYINQHSAFLDLGQVYGADYFRANALRSYSGGKLKMSPGSLLPKNKLTGEDGLGAKVSNAPDGKEEFYVGGDIRANEQVTLLVMHVLWAREHNRVCDELKELYPDDDDQLLFSTARTIVISAWQSIIYTEWLPLLLGPNAVPKDAYRYDESIDPSIMAFFSTVAFRFGHSLVNSVLWRMGSGPNPSVTSVPLREVFFKPQLLEQWGVEPFIRGACHHLARDIDPKVNDELRNFLFAEEENSPHMDLVSLNIQRARDMGLPKYNDAREAYGLPRYTEFSQISSDEAIWGPIAEVYEGNIDDVDAFVGGLAEDKYLDSLLGELFFTAIKDQFTRVRDGDRFFYPSIQWGEDILQQYPHLRSVVNDEIKLADIIVRNSEITYDEIHAGGRTTILRTA